MDASTPAFSSVTAKVKAVALREGFDLVGVASAEVLDSQPLDHWLSEGWEAGLRYMRDSRAERLDVTRVLPSAASVVAVAVSYRHPDPQMPDEPFGVVARYARGRDYHNVMRRPLKRLRAAIEAIVPGSVGYASCDARPVMEKAWAQRAGLGWIGKNGCLITPSFGSYVLLGCVITTARLDPDASHPERCGTCHACIPACPTGAIREPRYVDANRCIAYHTIEHREPIPEPVASNLEGRVFGCDICQEVCPWNRGDTAVSGRLANELRPHDGQGFVPLSALLGSAEQLAERIKATPLARTGVEGLQRTARALEATCQKSE